ncbi:uncharacterized protein LOC129237995 [Anastrepha obliqua]|uniref:uncharacterized protein LOC128856477 n=1 Tax=Anastrepha ludens TaxID=28586 RepID=UPI0023AFEF51|nr:uncharacterized protein LOC128856477 [Anastrepha ludens]XP_054728995.1 uncharacterized protein LOC129237995 [Anastrepha obliqua]
MSGLSMVFNGLLVGASGFALYTMPPAEHPYAFSACAFGLCHGLLGMIHYYKQDSEDCSKIHDVSTSVMEIIQLPLINIELYLASSESSALALGHGLFVIPLAFDLIAKLFTEEGDDSNTNTLKDLTILGNIMSLTFLAVNESNYTYVSMAITAFLTKYGAILLDSYWEGSLENTVLTGYSLFTFLANYAITEKPEWLSMK